MRVAVGNSRVRAVVAVSHALPLARRRARRRPDPRPERRRGRLLPRRHGHPDHHGHVPRPIFAPGHDAFLADILAVDPVAEAGNIARPVLLVRGGGDPTVTAADIKRLSPALRTGGQVMAGSAQSDHNLTLAGAGHEHSNTPTAQATHRDPDVFDGLTAWVKAYLAG